MLLVVQEYGYLYRTRNLSQISGHKEQWLLPIFGAHFEEKKKKGTPKRFLSDTFARYFTHVIFTCKINGPFITHIWEQGIRTAFKLTHQTTGFLKQ